MVADESDNQGASQVLNVLWQRKTLIGSLVLGAIIFAVLALQMITPRYSAEALVALNTKSSASEGLLSNKPVIATPQLTPVIVSSEVDILNSRGLAMQVVEALGLDQDEEFNPDLKGSVLPESVKAMIDGLKAMVGLVEEDKDTMTIVTDNVQKALKVKTQAESYVLRVGFESEDPKKAATIANAFADLYIRSQRESKLTDLQLASDWISRQIVNLRADLTAEQQAAVEFRQKHNISPSEAREAGTFTVNQLVALTEELAQVERERAEAESALSQARRVFQKGGSATSLTFVEESTFLQEMRREEAKILGRIAELSVGYRSESPAMAALKGQLDSLRGEITREIQKTVERMANKAAQAKAREDVIKARMAAISDRNQKNDPALTEIEQREKLITAKNLMLESFLGRYAELTNRAEIEEPDARIASRATAPSKPSYPKPFLFIGVALMGSLGLSVSLAFLLERFRNGFLNTRQIRDALGLPTLGILPDVTKMASKSTPSDYLMDKPESVYAEAVRSAQIGVLNARGDRRKPIMVTSSVPAEGKTTFCLSLGRSMAQSGKRVLVVDCDLRRPAVARHLGTYEVPGLSDFLRQQASLEEIIRHDSRSGLDFIASGSRTGEPQRLLEDKQLPALFESFTGQYDVVILDTPPTMVAFDAAILSHFSDFALYVVQWDKTPARAVQAGLEHLADFNVQVGGVVLTKVDLDRQRQHSDYVDFAFRNTDYYGN